MPEALTKAQARAAKADIKRKLRSLIKDLQRDAFKALDSGKLDGTGIFEMHHANDHDWAEAKNFYCAMLKEHGSRRGHGPMRQPDQRKVNNYWRFI